MSENLSIIGVSQQAVNEATGEVAKPFETLEAGCYKATVKQILMYTNTFDDKAMRYIVNITSEDRDIEFSKDINSTLKDKSVNGGYTNRYKQFLYAANTEESALSISPTPVKINSFGKDYEAQEILGMVGKPVIAEVLLMNDTTKADGEAYKLRNILSGVLAMDGTDASGQNKADEFTEKCKTKPVTDYAGYVKPAKATQGAVNKEAAADASSEGF